MNDSLFNCLSDYKLRHISMTSTIANWIRNRASYNVLDFDKIRKNIKKSDTIFILGTGESINDISETEWEHVAEHDSIALNWWPLHSFVPTYYHSEYPHEKEFFQAFKDILSKRISDNYKKTVFFLSLNRAVQRGIHPRVVPDLFPENPRICFYKYHKPLRFDNLSELDTSSFNRTLFYRGSLTAVLDLMNKIGYKQIVLLGVDLKSHIYFYENYPEMSKVLNAGYPRSRQQRSTSPHFTSISKSHKIAIHEYLFILNDLYYTPNNIKLFCGSPDSLLHDKLPLYQF